MPKLEFYEFVEHTTRSRQNHKAKILLDSINPDGVRLTTMEWVYPRFIHSEIMTNRVFSRNTASSRAIPAHKIVDAVRDNPVFRLHWGKNQKGMQAHSELELDIKLEVAGIWLDHRLDACKAAERMIELGSHKQDVNRLLEPWMWITAIVSSTNFENMLSQRCHEEAEPHYQELSYKVMAALDASEPSQLEWGEWHLPLFGFPGDEEIAADERPWVSAGRCARVSYLTHDGKRDVAADLELGYRLGKSRPLHATPLEHPTQMVPAMVGLQQPRSNFHPTCLQLRKLQPGECVYQRQQWSSVS